MYMRYLKLIVPIALGLVLIFSNPAGAVDLTVNYQFPLEQAQKRLEKLEKNAQSAQSQKEGTTERLTNFLTYAERTQAELTQVTNDINRMTQIAINTAVGAYMGDPATIAPMSLKEANKNLSRQEYSGTVITYTKDNIKQAQRKEKQLSNDLDVVKGQITATQETLASLETARQTTAQEIEDTKQEIASLEANIQEQEEYLASIIASYQNMRADIQADGKVLPLTTLSVSSPFGLRIHPISGVPRMHQGVDLSAPTGTPVFAALGGTVTKSGPYGGYGNYVCIKHNDALTTCYAHNSRILVAEGQEVDAGVVIALVGSTGASTGPHLHFEVIVQGVHVDPLSSLYGIG